MLYHLQKERITELLKTQESIPWKVLIIDQHGQDIIAPLIRVNELRDCNVTAHFLINQKRFKIKDIPAIYLIDSDEKNIKQLINDVKSELYAAFYINFINSISRDSLEQIAQELSEKGKALFIRNITDQYLGFISLQNNFFTLNCKNSFSNRVNENSIVQSLFGLFLTLKEAPFIVSDIETNNISENLILKIKNTNLIKNTRKKPLLILVDRNFDLKTPIEHVWSYSALIHDLLKIELNKVKIKNENIFDLDPNDEFWQENCEEYFPLVAERIEKELSNYKKEMALRCVDEKTDKKKIEETLEKTPELAKKKASLHIHMSICLALIEIIKKRSIDDFYRIEKNSYKKQELLDLSEKGEIEDIKRLGISILRKDNFNIVESLLKSRKIDTKILNIFKDKESIEQTGTNYKQVVSNILGSVKKLLPVNMDSLLSKYVEQIISKIKNQKLDEINLSTPFGNHCFEQEISKIVVFCNGGGTYSELKSLNELGRKINLEIIYGSTEILTAAGFIEQLKMCK